MTTLQKMAAYQNRITELYETKFNKQDWENKNPDAIKWFAKCKRQANKEFFNC